MCVCVDVPFWTCVCTVSAPSVRVCGSWRKGSGRQMAWPVGALRSADRRQPTGGGNSQCTGPRLLLRPPSCFPHGPQLGLFACVLETSLSVLCQCVTYVSALCVCVRVCIGRWCDCVQFVILSVFLSFSFFFLRRFAVCGGSQFCVRTRLCVDVFAFLVMEFSLKGQCRPKRFLVTHGLPTTTTHCGCLLARV